jgi:hypothetical protein
MTIGELFKLTMDLPFRSFISSRKRKLKERKPSAKPLISSLLRVLLFKKSELKNFNRSKRSKRRMGYQLLIFKSKAKEIRISSESPSAKPLRFLRYLL